MHCMLVFQTRQQNKTILLSVIASYFNIYFTKWNMSTTTKVGRKFKRRNEMEKKKNTSDLSLRRGRPTFFAVVPQPLRREVEVHRQLYGSYAATCPMHRRGLTAATVFCQSGLISNHHLLCCSCTIGKNKNIWLHCSCK